MQLHKDSYEQVKRGLSRTVTGGSAAGYKIFISSVFLILSENDKPSLISTSLSGAPRCR